MLSLFLFAQTILCTQKRTPNYIKHWGNSKCGGYFLLHLIVWLAFIVVCSWCLAKSEQFRSIKINLKKFKHHSFFRILQGLQTLFRICTSSQHYRRYQQPLRRHLSAIRLWKCVHFQLAITLLICHEIKFVNTCWLASDFESAHFFLCVYV